MTKREERGRLGTALLQPMAVYEAPKGESHHAMRDVHSGGGGEWVDRGNGKWRMLFVLVFRLDALR